MLLYPAAFFRLHAGSRPAPGAASCLRAAPSLRTAPQLRLPLICVLLPVFVLLPVCLLSLCLLSALPDGGLFEIQPLLRGLDFVERIAARDGHQLLAFLAFDGLLLLVRDRDALVVGSIEFCEHLDP